MMRRKAPTAGPLPDLGREAGPVAMVGDGVDDAPAWPPRGSAMGAAGPAAGLRPPTTRMAPISLACGRLLRVVQLDSAAAPTTATAPASTRQRGGSVAPPAPRSRLDRSDSRLVGRPGCRFRPLDEQMQQRGARHWTTASSPGACRRTRCGRTRPVHALQERHAMHATGYRSPENTRCQFGLTNVPLSI
jgi:hypothetical protein